MMDVILLAGGLGTRLAAVSGGLPKPMVEVAGRPFIEHVLASLSRAGVQRIIIAASYRWEILKARLGSQFEGCLIDWSIEEEPLGTGGAIRLALSRFEMERALVLNADTFIEAPLASLETLHVRGQALVTLLLREVEDVHRYGEVILDADGRVTAFREKERHGRGVINAGVYVVDQRVFEGVPDGRCSFEVDILARKVGQGGILGLVGGGYFVDIGIPEDLERARHDFSLSAHRPS